MSLPSSMADFVPCDRLLQKAYLRLKERLAISLKKEAKAKTYSSTLCVI